MGAFTAIFGKPKMFAKSSKWREIGSYRAVFIPFGSDAYRSEVVRSCVRPLADYTAKANFKSSDKALERLFRDRPNMYMTGHDLLYKVRTMLELKNTAFIYIARDDKGHVQQYYPVPYQSFEAEEYNGRLYINFKFANGSSMVASWNDLAVLRKDYYRSDIAGEDNYPILNTLDLINTTNQGIANAVKATANLRGILKSTKSMLDSADLRKQKEQFVKDYLSLENEGGIASLDATQEFTPITMSPTIATYTQQKEFRENAYRYFGVNDSIIMGTASEDEREGFYQSRIEPFLVALSQELTYKSFTDRERGFGAYIVMESNKLQYASNDTKLKLVELVDRGILSPNEVREAFNLAPYAGGDEFIRRLDTATTGNSSTNESTEGSSEEGETDVN